MKLNKNLYKVAAVAGLALLAGCGKDIGQTLDEPRLMNVWEGKCADSTVLKVVTGLKSSKQFFKFAGASYKEVHTFYAEDNCVGEAIDVTYDGDVTLKDKVSDNSRKVDFRFDHVGVTALNAKGKGLLEGVKFCGVGVYEVGKPAGLDGKTGAVTCPLRTVPTGEFNLYQFDGETLFLGKSGLRGGATKETDRPTSIERGQPFVKSARSL